MRVISGTAKGLRLKGLDLPNLRPMLDRVKEATFNVLRAEIEGRDVLDLFSGCGALGIEALSRGAARCLFVERDPRLACLIGENLQKARLAERAEVLREDVLGLPARRPPDGYEGAPLALVDPPYALVKDPGRRERLLETLGQMVPLWISPGGLVVLHHEPSEDVQWPTGAAHCVEKKVYGRSQVSFFRIRHAGGSDE